MGVLIQEEQEEEAGLETRGVTEMEEEVEDEVVVAMALAKECRIRLRS